MQTESSFKLKDRETIEHESNITRASHEIGSHPFHHTISKEFSLLSHKTMFKPGAKTLSLLCLLAKNMPAVHSGVGVIINSLICCLRQPFLFDQFSANRVLGFAETLSFFLEFSVCWL